MKYTDDPTWRVLDGRARDATANLNAWIATNKHRFARWPIGTCIFRFSDGHYEGAVLAHAVREGDVDCLVAGAHGRVIGVYPSDYCDGRGGTADERLAWLEAEASKLRGPAKGEWSEEQADRLRVLNAKAKEANAREDRERAEFAAQVHRAQRERAALKDAERRIY